MAISLAELAPELLSNIAFHLISLEDNVAFSCTCQQLQALYTEDEWRKTLRRCNYGRPVAASTNTRKKLAAALVKHAKKCVYCRGIHAEHATVRTDSGIILSTKEAIAAHPTVAASSYLERRPSEEDMICPDTSHLVAYLAGATWTPREERCFLSSEGQDAIQKEYKAKHGKAMSKLAETKRRRLVSHLNAMCLFATTIPIKQLSLENFLDADSPYYDLMMDVIDMDMDGDDYFNTGPSTLYPNTIMNEHGLTCYDVIRAGANWKIDPGYNALFGGLSLHKDTAVSAKHSGTEHSSDTS